MTAPNVLNKLRVLKGVAPGNSTDFHTISDYVKAHFSHRPDQPVKVLEAGCGHQPFLEPTTMDYRITGVDLSPDEIALKNKKSATLKWIEKVRADLSIR